MFFWSYSFAWPVVHWGLVLLTALIVATLLPTFIAFIRRHHNRYAILVLNVLLGWTVVGWAVALVWSLTAVWRNTNPASPVGYET